MILKNIFTLNKLKAIILIIVIVYLTAVISDLIWFIVNKENNTTLVNKTTIAKKATNKLPLGIFGVEAKKVVKKTYKKVKATKLDLILVGIINGKDAFAIIQPVAGFDKIYKIGAKINSSARLKDIGNDFVIIDHNGLDEKLVLKFKTNKDIEKNIKKTSVNKSLSNKNHSNAKFIVKLKPKNKNKLKNYLQKAKVNPTSVLSVVAVEPNFIAGLLDGFKVFPSKERDLFFKLGFKSGDIVVKINDTELNSLAKAFSIGKSLARLKTFTFVVKRKNTQKTIYLDLN